MLFPLFLGGCGTPEAVISTLRPDQLAKEQIYYLEVDQGTGQSIELRVDPRVELFSILALLAGYEEYSAPLDTEYSRAVREHFGPFREHPAVARMLSARHWDGISHDSVINLAVHVTDPPLLAERISFDAHALDGGNHSLDDRWSPRAARQLLEDTRRFAFDSDFTGFWRAHRPTFEDVEARFGALLADTPLLRWIDDFFGIEPGTHFYAIPGMLTGGANYGATVRSEDEAFVYQVIGASRSGPEGKASFSSDVVGIMVHEYSHAFVNPFVGRAGKPLTEAGNRLFRAMRDQMRRQAYGSGFTVMCESLVRAVTVRYFEQHASQQRVQAELRNQMGRGFLWTEELSELLAVYEESRDVYPTLDDFKPRIEEFFDRYLVRFPEVLDDWDARLDYWRKLNPIVGGALRREVVMKLHEVQRIVDRTHRDPELLRVNLERLNFDGDAQVTVIDSEGEFVFHVQGLTGSAYGHTDLSGREVYRDLNESTERAGMAFNVDYVSDDRNSARANVIAYERFAETGWLLCVEGHEWQTR